MPPKQIKAMKAMKAKETARQSDGAPLLPTATLPPAQPPADEELHVRGSAPAEDGSGIACAESDAESLEVFRKDNARVPASGKGRRPGKGLKSA